MPPSLREPVVLFSIALACLPDRHLSRLEELNGTSCKCPVTNDIKSYS